MQNYIGYKENKEIDNQVTDGKYFVYKSGVIFSCDSKEEVIQKAFELGGLPYKKNHSDYIEAVNLELPCEDDGTNISFNIPVGTIKTPHYFNSVGKQSAKIVSVDGRVVVWQDDKPRFQFYNVNYADGNCGDCGCSIPELQEIF